MWAQLTQLLRRPLARRDVEATATPAIGYRQPQAISPAMTSYYHQHEAQDADPDLDAIMAIRRQMHTGLFLTEADVKRLTEIVERTEAELAQPAP